MMNLCMYVLSMSVAAAPPTVVPVPVPTPVPTAGQAPPSVPNVPPVPAMADKPPSLDEALGLGNGGKQSDTTTDASELQRSLDGAKPRDILNSAIDDMKHSAQLLEANDSGISTRRVQESVVRKLDELIATAQRMKQQQSQQGQESQGQQSQGQSGKGKNQGKDQGAKDGKDGQDGKDGKDGKKPPRVRCVLRRVRADALRLGSVKAHVPVERDRDVGRAVRRQLHDSVRLQLRRA